MLFKRVRRLKRPKSLVFFIIVAITVMGIKACAPAQSPANQAAAESPATEATVTDLTGDVVTDGSSTVFPIAEAMAEEFQKANPNVRVTVGTSGTGGGFEKFCAGETAISNASRPIEADEKELCRTGGVEFIELPIAFDALTVVVHPENTWARELTTAELRTMWEPAAQGEITNWNQIRSDFPDAPLALFGPGTDSGTFDYFTEAINGEEGASRGDFTASEDDNVLVQGVAGNRNALGYFGLAYYEANQDRLERVAIDDGNADNGSGFVSPSPETVLDGTYQPLSRPLFIYVNSQMLDRPEVKAFVDFYLDPAHRNLVNESGYIAMSDPVYDLVLARLNNRTTGSLFEGATVGVNIQDVLAKQ
ncbi:phosphate ABC transporter substrate-binding protein, PhoT family (plasmid) [Gloeocapsa sp. PCC 7428]|uniref:PstS family phosphate ABC transporter substrate-binding protein n=1 Tax=Gloeocapsa sp. PCC 7428 TaxID=1173026 RepID=UPI0002A5CFE6|nr:PstS family phosphate ABC transporter substrate-binding protein [Gloeocapsa sp. PCC 7428]AFZ33387.1 phosphate ABC transporter substrate-binding protein, PhoT family [Gloeocapsa sp. PCC 7428]